MEEHILSNYLAYIKSICWLVIIGGGVYILYQRSKKKLVTLKEIEQWAITNRGNGTHVMLHKLSVLPDEVKKEVRQEVGFKKVLYGYKDDASIHATILDENNTIVKRMLFSGNVIDKELIEGFGNNQGINIKLV